MTVRTMTKARCIAGAALLLCGNFSTAALAQNAPAAGQEPVADAGTTIQLNCIAENDGFKMNGKQATFVIELENKCEQRMKCRVFAYINSAKGPSQGQGTIVLAAKSRGAAAKGTFTMKTRMVDGNSQSTRECRAI